MQSARSTSAIPRVELHGYPSAASVSESYPSITGPFLDDTEYSPAEGSSWGWFGFDDLHETNFAPPPRDNQAEVNPSLQRQWLFQSPYQRETSWGPQWDADDDPTALPHGISGLASRQDFYCPVPPETFFQSSSNSWRSNQIPEPPWNRYSTTFSDLDSPSLERNPSLDTDISRRSVSLESHLDAASIFGASDWPGLLPFDPALKESTANAGEQFNLLLEQEAISKSWDLDSLRGSALVPPLHYPLLALPMNSGDVFSRKNVDSNSHRVDLDISGNYGNDSQLFSAQTSPNPAPAGLMERPENSSQIQHQAQPSHMNVSLGCQDHIQPSADHDFSWNRFIVEDGSGNANVPSLPRRKGARHGRLPAHKAKMTAERRKSGKTCIKCRVTRVECDGGDPCNKCIKLAKTSSLAQPCIKANFLDIIKSGSCNYISQRAINHFTLDESRRVKMFLSEAFDVNQLLHLLENRRNKFNIRARQASGSLYVLDLDKCYDFLGEFRRSSTVSDTDYLRSFIDHSLVKTGPWHKCVKECDPTRNKILLLSQWNNMPSRASYDLVPLAKGAPERPLDPLNEDDKLEILIAAQISRIVCRKLEIDGYQALQSEINNMRSSNSTYTSRTNAATKLGKILLSLRWRMSWWKLLGDGSNNHDPFRDRFVERVELLSKALYFYYFTVKNRIGSWNELGRLRGEMSSYPDAEPVFDDFPTVASIEGFEEWLNRGLDLIKEANCEKRFER